QAGRDGSSPNPPGGGDAGAAPPVGRPAAVGPPAGGPAPRLPVPQLHPAPAGHAPSEGHPGASPVRLWELLQPALLREPLGLRRLACRRVALGAGGPSARRGLAGQAERQPRSPRRAARPVPGRGRRLGEVPRGQADPSKFGIHFAGLRGLWFIAGSIVRDLAALNGAEMLPWDVWGCQPRPGEQLNSEQLASFDRLAQLSQNPDGSFAELRRLYNDDE